MRFSKKDTEDTQARALAIIQGAAKPPRRPARISNKEVAKVQRSVRTSMDRIVRQGPALAAKELEQRVQRLRTVAESDKPIGDRLQVLREIVPAEKNAAQQTLVWAYTFILEVNSAGLAILFDRYKRSEIAKFDKALEAIGARKSRAALAKLLVRMNKLTAGGMTWFDAGLELDEDPASLRISKAGTTYVDEVEPRLLKYCQKNIEQLAAVPRARKTSG